MFKAPSWPLPPQTIISLPVHTAVWYSRAAGALVVLVGVHVSVVGLYLPPLLKYGGGPPPQTIISLPIHTAVWLTRVVGALVVLVAVHVSSMHGPGVPVGVGVAVGVGVGRWGCAQYLPPVLKKLVLNPPQTTISVLVHTAV